MIYHIKVYQTSKGLHALSALYQVYCTGGNFEVQWEISIIKPVFRMAGYVVLKCPCVFHILVVENNGYMRPDCSK